MQPRYSHLDILDSKGDEVKAWDSTDPVVVPSVLDDISTEASTT